MRHLIVAGGGTAGHLFPAITVGGKLKKHNFAVHVITDQRCQKFLTSHTLIQHVIKIFPPRSGLLNKFLCALTILVACLKIFKIYHKVKPALIIGFGGYPTFAPLLIAKITKVPILLYEQNSCLSRVNRYFCKYSEILALTHPKTRNIPSIPPDKIVIAGYLAREIFQQQNIKHKRDFFSPIFHILVIGGSQGARIFSDLIPAAIKLVKNHKISITQQTNDSKQVEKIYQSLGIQYHVAEFFDDILDQYLKSQLVICRAGASTIAELVQLGQPAIMIPLPSAAQNHQLFNAKTVAENQGGWYYEQKSINAQILADKISELIENRPLLQQASTNITQLQKSTASILTDTALEIINMYSTS